MTDERDPRLQELGCVLAIAAKHVSDVQGSTKAPDKPRGGSIRYTNVDSPDEYIVSEPGSTSYSLAMILGSEVYDSDQDKWLPIHPD